MSEPSFKVIREGAVLDLGSPRPRAVDILIENGTIREVGRPGLAVPDDAEIIPARDRLLIPGLVNAHTHSHHTLAKGIAGDWTLEMLLNAGPWAAGGRSHEDLYLGALLGAAEMVRKGCTACYDMVLELPVPSPEGIGAVARAYRDIGMRAVVAPAVADRTFWSSIPGLVEAMPQGFRKAIERIQAAPGEASLEGVNSVLSTWPFDCGQIRPAVAPSIPLLCSDEFLSRAAALAREHDVFLHTHLAESKVQAVAGMRRYGCTLTQHLDALGILGPHFGAAHAVWIDDEDIRRLADKGASVAHNPGSNLRLGNGIAPVREMVEKGLNVGIGTDTSSCSDQLNMFEAMRLATFSVRAETPDCRRWIGAADVLEMATVGSARILGFENIGRIEPGYAADIVFLDLRDVNYVPLNDARTQVVFCENGGAVATVMVGGRVLYDQGRFLTIDYYGMVERVAAAAARLAKANAGRKRELDAVASVVGTFCIGLAGEPYHVHRYVGEDRWPS